MKSFLSIISNMTDQILTTGVRNTSASPFEQIIANDLSNPNFRLNFIK